MQIVSETTIETTTPTRREHKPRGAFGLDYVSRTEYQTPDGTGGIEQEGREWFAWHGDRTAGPMSMKQAANFARRG